MTGNVPGFRAGVREARKSARKACIELAGAVQSRHYLAATKAPDGSNIYDAILRIDGELTKLIADLKAVTPKDD